MTPVPNELWLVNGLFAHEKPQIVRIMEVLPSGNVDVNYQLNPRRHKDLRILPKECLIEKIERPPDILP